METTHFKKGHTWQGHFVSEQKCYFFFLREEHISIAQTQRTSLVSCKKGQNVQNLWVDVEVNDDGDDDHDDDHDGDDDGDDDGVDM